MLLQEEFTAKVWLNMKCAFRFSSKPYHCFSNSSWLISAQWRILMLWI